MTIPRQSAPAKTAGQDSPRSTTNADTLPIAALLPARRDCTACHRHGDTPGGIAPANLVRPLDRVIPQRGRW